MLSNTIIKIVIFAVIVFVAFTLYNNYLGKTNESVQGLGIPVQTVATGTVKKTVSDWDVNINFRYSYDIDALVVHTKRYSSGSIADLLAPVDLALAWGDVAALNDEIDFHWRQSGRWVYWSVDNNEDLNKAGGMSNIYSNCANNHIIPADDYIEKAVKSFKAGDHIHLKGYLVEVNCVRDNGSTYNWVSSFSRNDSGDHSCEVFYVTNAEKI
ncbi:MAG: hypothetical protein K6B52_04915 [Clostridiales bacterium]|nr:hypothetical protein [Clostridiales bacterium]